MPNREGRAHSLCKLHKYYLCISQVIHKISQIQSFWSCTGTVEASHSKPIELAKVPLFWTAGSHPVMLQTTVLHTLLTTHSVMCGHSQIKKTHSGCLFCWAWMNISRGLQNHTVTSYCTTQALPGLGPHYWLFHRPLVFTPVTCSTGSVLHWIQSNCWLPTKRRFHLFSVPSTVIASLMYYR